MARRSVFAHVYARVSDLGAMLVIRVLMVGLVRPQLVVGRVYGF